MGGDIVGWGWGWGHEDRKTTGGGGGGGGYRHFCSFLNLYYVLKTRQAAPISPSLILGRARHTIPQTGGKSARSSPFINAFYTHGHVNDIRLDTDLPPDAPLPCHFTQARPVQRAPSAPPIAGRHHAGPTRTSARNCEITWGETRISILTSRPRRPFPYSQYATSRRLGAARNDWETLALIVFVRYATLARSLGRVRVSPK